MDSYGSQRNACLHNQLSRTCQSTQQGSKSRLPSIQGREISGRVIDERVSESHPDKDVHADLGGSVVLFPVNTA